MKNAMKNSETAKQVQEAVDWMFLMALEFFGVADGLKSRSSQLEYSLKGKTNDELRQVWLSTAIPFCEKIGVKVPAKYNEETKKYELTVPFPCEFDVENKKWNFDKPDTWENVIKRFKARGPQNKEFIERVQKGHVELENLRKEVV